MRCWILGTVVVAWTSLTLAVEPSTRIFVVAHRGGKGLVIVAIDPKDKTQVELGKARGYLVRVAPGGRTLVYQSGDALWLAELSQETGRMTSPISLADRHWGRAAWSRDGKKLLLSIDQGKSRKEYGRSYETWLAKPDGTGHEPLAIPATDLVYDWSPDGTLVATIRRPEPTLHVMRLDGTGDRRLTVEGRPSNPRFSSDSRRIAYIRREDGERLALLGVQPVAESSVWVVNVDGTDARKVYQATEAAPVEACWSPDGTRLAVVVIQMDPLTGRISKQPRCRVEIMDHRGENREVIPLPDCVGVGGIDWR
jgi:dipeptidyl aminopeptidase/acylaminoacyl peptidase